MALEPINCSAHARDIEDVYQKIVRDSDPDTTWMIISPNAQKEYLPETTGSDFSEFLGSFDETKVQYGFARITPPGSDVGKNILIGWCPDSAAMKSRASFAANFGVVANTVLKSYHVQVSARDSDDLAERDILKRISDAAGARYSIQSSDSNSAASKPRSSVASKPAPIFNKPKPTPVVNTPKPAVSKPANNDDDWDEPEVEERDFSANPLKPNASTYKPIGKVDLQKVIAEEKAKEDPRLVHNGPVVGTKPPINVGAASTQSDSDHLVKGFKTEKSPAELWAEKKAAKSGSTTTQREAPQQQQNASQEEDTEEHLEEVDELKSKFEKLSANAEPQVITPKPFSKPQQVEEIPSKTNIKMTGTPLPGMHNEEPEKDEEDNNDDDWNDDEEQEQAPQPLPPRNVRPEQEQEQELEEQEPEQEEEADVPPPPLPSREQVQEPEPEATLPLPARESSAPPPPPRKVATQEKPALATAVAEYDYDAAEDNELTFVEGTKIINIEFVDDDWWLGENGTTGEKGLFPANYVSLEN
ncbi:hypothetical protein TPHA_0H02380 [Tetrapisispora phaffii CBS 4417]|uniref:Actin-binding protein n=1 Tax=Tetrapisispora phaffii (strain ATCC 24235 / CBS 4417 / NBRC 1672 / NRRL Y-8282 / UCD 70-5) TaxID=1071381 RepID=G8BWJ1_TETPH|nr:hypothetical protein TPHA_0H02380 [Tetrapisispora phaffii CBS 4417]CCE64442.1 hypothetical protein TPHA_0H02380 [Tetrapisispora phaffii CBS 4417]